MAQDVTIVIRAKDAASKALAATGALLGKMGNKAKGAGAEALKTAKGMELMAAGGAVLGGVLGVLTVAITGTTAAMAGLYKIGQKALGAWEEQEGVNADLADSLSRAGVEANNLQSEFDELNKMAGEFSVKTMFGDEDILRSMSKYVQLTGDAKISQQELSTILGIAAKTKRDTTSAAELYAKALKGEIGPLKDVTSITKEQEERLNAIVDPTKRAAKAQEILAAQFAGVAEAANPTFNAIKNLEDAQGDLWQMMGSVIERSGAIPIVLSPVTKAFRAVEAWVDKNHVTLQRYVIDGVLFAVGVFRGFLTILKGANQLLGEGYRAVKAVGLAYEFLYEMVKIAGNGMVDFITGALSTVIEGFDKFLAKAESVASFVSDDMALKITKARGVFKGVKEDLDAIGKASVANTTQNLKNMEAITKQVKELEEDDSVMFQAFDKGLDRIINKTIEVDRKLLDAKKNASKPTVGAAVQTKGKKDGGLSKARKDAADLARRNELAKRQLAILNETNETRKASLELQLKIYEITSNKQLTAMERKKEARKAELDYEKTLADLQKKRFEAEKKRAEEAKKEQEERNKLIMAQMQRENAALTALSQGLGRLVQGADGVNMVAAGFEHLINLTAEANRLQAEYNTGVITGSQAVSQAFSMAAGAAAVFAEQMGATAKEQAVILSLFELAASVASFAAGDVFGGAQHAAASAMYATVAATSSSAPASAGAGSAGSSGGGSRGGGGPSVKDEREKSAEMLAEKLGAVLGGGNTINVFYDDRSTNLSNDPRTGDQLLDVVDGAAKRRGIDLKSNKYRRN
jgi:hypothetical protein